MAFARIEEAIKKLKLNRPHPYSLSLSRRGNFRTLFLTKEKGRDEVN